MQIKDMKVKISGYATLMLGLIMLSAGCGRHEITVDDYRQWINAEDNGLSAQKELNGLVYKVQFRPIEYRALELLQYGKQEMKKAQFDSTIKQICGNQHFILEVSRNDGMNDVVAANVSNREEYYHRLVTLSYNMSENIKLVQDKDTLPCRLAQFEQMYSATPYARLSLVFDALPAEIAGYVQGDRPAYTDKVIVYNDVVWGAGIIKLKLLKQDLNNIPQVSL